MVTDHFRPEVVYGIPAFIPLCQVSLPFRVVVPVSHYQKPAIANVTENIYSVFGLVCFVSGCVVEYTVMSVDQYVTVSLEIYCQ